MKTSSHAQSSTWPKPRGTSTDTRIVVEAPAASMTDVGETVYDAPPANESSTAKVNVAAAPVRFLTTISPERFCPEPEGTPPKAMLTGSSDTFARTALYRFSSPAPTMFGLSSKMVTPPTTRLWVRVVPVAEFLRTPRTAVFTIAERTSAAVQPGCCSITTAADPATCGVAIDVPWKNAQQEGVFCTHLSAGCELRTFTPGATTSGLTRNWTSVGPMLEKPAMMLSFAVRKYSSPAWIVVRVPSGFAASARPSSSPTMYAGIVGWFGRPSEAIAVGSPATLLTTSTATAPAFCAFRIFTEKVQTPREIRAISPVRLPAGSAVQAVLSPVAVFVGASVTTSSGAVRFAVTVLNSPAAAP